MPMIRQHSPREAGFGIVVVALLFTAFSVIVALMIDRSSVQIELERQQQVEEQLSRLNISLARYARYGSHRFPCPASYLLPTTDGAFGSAVSADCRGSTPTGIEQFGPSNRLVTGMVPVRELIPYGVSYNEAFDPWGSRVMYVVHRNLTTGSTDADVYSAIDAERPDVRDYQTGDLIVPGPDTVLISYGRDRMGGRLRNQASLTNPSITCGSGQKRNENCDGDRFFFRGPIITGTRIAPADYFDDTISTMRYTANSAGGSCAGTVVGTYCWYLATASTSCDAACTTHGGYNPATLTYAGTGGTLANCQGVLIALGIPGVASDAGPAGIGCSTRSGNLYRSIAGPTTNSASSPSYSRACACNN